MTDLFRFRSAIISPCGLFRYQLKRVWDEAMPPLIAGMLNPSHADSQRDDPTVVRMIHRARLLGCGSLVIWNLFSIRGDDPKIIRSAEDPIGPKNDEHIRNILIDCKARYGVAFVGWGSQGIYKQRHLAIIAIANELGIQFVSLGSTLNGQPCHPLYKNYSINLTPWNYIA